MTKTITIETPTTAIELYNLSNEFNAMRMSAKKRAIIATLENMACEHGYIVIECKMYHFNGEKLTRVYHANECFYCNLETTCCTCGEKKQVNEDGECEDCASLETIEEIEQAAEQVVEAVEIVEEKQPAADTLNIPEHYKPYKHDTTYDYQVKQYGERCGYTYTLESILEHGSIAFKRGVIVAHARFLAGRRVCHITKPDGTSYNCSIGLLDDLVALLPNGMDDVQGDWAAIAVRRHGEEGTIDDLLEKQVVSSTTTTEIENVASIVVMPVQKQEEVQHQEMSPYQFIEKVVADSIEEGTIPDGVYVDSRYRQALQRATAIVIFNHDIEIVYRPAAKMHGKVASIFCHEEHEEQESVTAYRHSWDGNHFFYYHHACVKDRLPEEVTFELIALKDVPLDAQCEYCYEAMHTQQIASNLIPFAHPIQTATAIAPVYDIHRTTLTRAFARGELGDAAYRSSEAILIDTRHSDWLKWLRTHENQPRTKGFRKQERE